MPSSLFGSLAAALFPPPEPSAGGEEEVAYGTGGKGGVESDRWDTVWGPPSGGVLWDFLSSGWGGHSYYSS